MRDALRAAAVAACESAGDLVRERFRAGRIDGDYGETDVKTDLDVAAEERMRDVVADSFPDHAVLAEESGRHDGEGYEWILDPLDGTNNVAAGLPVFATAAAVRERGGDDAVLAVVHEPLVGETCVAERGAGTTVNGEPVSADSDLALFRATVSVVPGLEALRDPAGAETVDALHAALDDACKRTLSTWAPCVDWGLLARGDVEAVVTYHPDVWEHAAGTLVAREAGAVAWQDGPLAVHAANEELLAAVRGAIAPVVR